MFLDRDIEARLAALGERSRRRELRRETAVSFSHNDYLGLAAHPEIVDAGIRALREDGAGSRGSRLLGGNTARHEEAEAAIAAYFGAPAALLFSTGYLANLALLQSLAPLVDGFVSDERNHASLIDGMALAKRPKAILPHQRWDRIPEPFHGKRLVLVAETLYGMDGDFVDAPALVAARDRHEAFVVLDESHAAGVFFEDGRGLAASWGAWDRTAAVVTFGKAFGVAGAAVVGSRALKEWIVNTGRSFIFTTAPPPAVAAMVTAALGVAARERGLREELWSRAETARAFLREAGVGTLPDRRTRWDDRSPVLPLLVPGDDKALRFSQSMQDFGWSLRAIRYPTVPEGGERLRLSLNLSVDRATTERMLRELVRRWTEFS